MHPEDKRAALKRVRKKLEAAFEVVGLSEPSDRLINLCFNILQTDVVRYIPWEKCTSRQDETRDPKFDEDPGLKLLSDGTFAQARNAGPDADLSSELRWDLALRRRAIAMDIAGLCTFEGARLWHEKLKVSHLAEAIPGRARISWLQLKLADQALFDHITKETSITGVRTEPGAGKTKFQEHWVTGTMEQSVTIHLQPLPLATTGRGSSSSGGPGTSSTILQVAGHDDEMAKLKRRLDQAENAIRKRKQPDSYWPQDKGKGKGNKGKGKDKNKGTARRAGREDRSGWRPQTRSGRKICWNYNRHGCADAQPGGECSRGMHICVVCPNDEARPLSSHT